MTLLDQHLLSRLPELRSLTYHSYGKSNSTEREEFPRSSSQLQRVQFIRKGVASYTDLIPSAPSNELVMAVQELTNQKNSRQSMLLHTIPYPDKVLHLPFLHWNKIQYANDLHRRSPYQGRVRLSKRSRFHCCHLDYFCNDVERTFLFSRCLLPDRYQWESFLLEIYDRVERVRLNLSERCLSSDFPTCRHVKQLTLISNNDQQSCLVTPMNLSSLIHLPSVHHLILNTSLPLAHFHSAFLSMSLDTLDIAWSQLRSFVSIGKIKNLSLIRECVVWKEIEYLVYQFLPHLKHLQMECDNE